jgi:hypothetical protein
MTKWRDLPRAIRPESPDVMRTVGLRQIESHLLAITDIQDPLDDGKRTALVWRTNRHHVATIAGSRIGLDRMRALQKIGRAYR